MVQKRITISIGKKSKKYSIELKNEISATRALKNLILDISYEVIKRKEEAILLLTNPKITIKRIENEFEKLKKIIRPEIADCMNIIIYENGKFTNLGKPLKFDVDSELEKLIPKLPKVKGISLNPPDIYFELLKVLIYTFFKQKGPLTSEWLAKEAIGCSYPPIAKALKTLGNYIERHSDRRVELNQFPMAEWNELLVMSGKVRSTVNFTDISGQPRTPDFLLKKIRDMKRKDIGIGGISGSLYHFPELNISGSHRLDLSIHSIENEYDLGFIEDLDPSLKKANNSNDPIHLSVHFIRRKDPFFTIDKDEEIWADPVECLLDLHNARLESQAEEFLGYMLEKRKK